MNTQNTTVLLTIAEHAKAVEAKRIELITAFEASNARAHTARRQLEELEDDISARKAFVTDTGIGYGSDTFGTPWQSTDFARDFSLYLGTEAAANAIRAIMPRLESEAANRQAELKAFEKANDLPEMSSF